MEQTMTALLPRGKEYLVRTTRRFGIIANVTSALGDYIIGEIWKRRKQSFCGIALAESRSFYGEDAVKKAKAWLAERFATKPRLRQYRCPASRATELGWHGPDPLRQVAEKDKNPNAGIRWFATS
jgi:hypothetical protein